MSEDEPKKNPRIMAASHLGAMTEKHYNEMELCDELQPNEAFAINAEGFDLGLLRGLAEDKSTGKKAFVVFEHEEQGCFEVRRLKDGRSPKRYYAELAGQPTRSNVGTDDKTAAQIQIEKVKSVIAEVIGGPLHDARKYEQQYSEEMQKEKMIPYGILHRRLASVSVFRKDRRGPTPALRSAVDTLCNDGYLRVVPKGFAEATFGFGGELYKLEKDEK